MSKLGKAILITACGVLVAAVILALVVGRPYEPMPRKSYEELLAEKKPARSLEYQNDANWKRGEYGNIFIAGTVKNESGKSYRYAQISFNLLDKAGNQIGNAFANVTGLEPGRAWKFEAIVEKTDGLHTFEFHEVKAY